jgi:creatinine amidohydrolase
MSEIEWSRLKASEIRGLAARNAIVIVPIGATEQHGPHLPSMVDWRCVHEVSHRAARLMEKTTPVVVAPTIPYGMSEHHMSLNGTITLDYATMEAVIRCVVTSSIRHGFRRIFVLNGHGGNTTALQNMIGELTVAHKLPLATGTYWDIAAGSIAKLLDRQKALLQSPSNKQSQGPGLRIRGEDRLRKRRQAAATRLPESRPAPAAGRN